MTGVSLAARTLSSNQKSSKKGSSSKKSVQTRCKSGKYSISKYATKVKAIQKGGKKLKVVTLLASSIAHELRNYLTAINISTDLSEKRLHDIKKAVKNADYFLRNIQLQIHGVIAGKPLTGSLVRCSIARNIQETVDQYPFKDGEKQLIKIENNDSFEYLGDPVLTNHVLYNLLKNSLRAIENSNKSVPGYITVRFLSDEKFNYLIFKDTSTGISSRFLPKVFELFETNFDFLGGSGVGLAFCQRAMRSYGGNITCQSQEGEYTKFTLSFPKI